MRSATSTRWAARPLTALAIAGFPDRVWTRETIRQIFLGGFDKLREAGVALLGGHTVRDPEIKFGYAVTGAIDPERDLTNAGARAGDVLVLTKPLGTGIVGTAIKFGPRAAGAGEARDRVDDDPQPRGCRSAAPFAGDVHGVHGHHRFRPDRPCDRDGRGQQRDPRPMQAAAPAPVSTGIAVTPTARAGSAPTASTRQEFAGCDGVAPHSLTSASTRSIGRLLVAVDAGRG